MKIITQLVLIIFLGSFLQLCLGAAFSADTIVSLNSDGSSTWLQEYKVDGTKVQRIDLTFSSGFVDGGFTNLRNDLTGATIILPLTKTLGSNSFLFNAWTINSNGDKVDETIIPVTRTDYCDIAINGTDVWFGTHNALVYTKRGTSSAVITPNVSTQPGAFSAVQLSGTKMYVSTSAAIKYISPPVTTNTAVFSATGITKTDSRMFVFDPQTIYVFDGDFVKYTINAQGAATQVFRVTPNLNNAYVRQLIAIQVSGTTYVFYATSLQSDNKLMRYTDTGSTLTDLTQMDQGMFFMTIGISPKATCSDSLKNQDETDVDCGGSTCDTCANNKACSKNSDCTSQQCTSNICVAQTCSDVIKNQDESDVDCGGTKCTGCVIGKTCSSNSDCLSNKCTGNVCVISCSDGVQNQNETDVDCGGQICSACANNKACLASSDCTSSYCNPDSLCSTPSCSDGYLNQDETDLDCGGSVCSACDNAKSCLVPGDCTSNYCNPESKCSTPSCSDGYLNQDETDLDCGGANCLGCVIGKSCIKNADCESNYCVDKQCDLPPPVAPIAPVPVTNPIAAPLNEPVAAPIAAPVTDRTDSPIRKIVSASNKVAIFMPEIIATIIIGTIVVLTAGSKD